MQSASGTSLSSFYERRRVFLRFALAGGGAIALAYLSRKYFEERFLRLKDSLVPQTPPSESKAISTSTPQGTTEAA